MPRKQIIENRFSRFQSPKRVNKVICKRVSKSLDVCMVHPPRSPTPLAPYPSRSYPQLAHQHVQPPLDGRDEDQGRPGRGGRGGRRGGWRRLHREKIRRVTCGLATHRSPQRSPRGTFAAASRSKGAKLATDHNDDDDGNEEGNGFSLAYVLLVTPLFVFAEKEVRQDFYYYFMIIIL